MSDDRFRLQPGTADRVIDLAFPVYRSRVKEGGIGFDARSLVTDWMDEDLAQEITHAQVISCIAYHAFISDENLRRPKGFQFHKAMLAIVAGGWWGEPGVAIALRHESAPGIEIVSAPRDADSIYPDVEETWEASVRALERALETLVEMGNDLLAQARLSWNWL